MRSPSNTFPLPKPCLSGCLHRLRHDRAGTAAVEFGLLALPFVALIFGVMEFGMLAWTHSSLQYAVEKAARCATVNTTLCGTPAQIQQYAASQMLAPGAVAADFTYTSTSCGNQVAATISYAFVVKVFLPAYVTLTAHSCHPA